MLGPAPRRLRGRRPWRCAEGAGYHMAVLLLLAGVPAERGWTDRAAAPAAWRRRAALSVPAWGCGDEVVQRGGGSRRRSRFVSAPLSSVRIPPSWFVSAPAPTSARRVPRRCSRGGAGLQAPVVGVSIGRSHRSARGMRDGAGVVRRVMLSLSVASDDGAGLVVGRRHAPGGQLDG